MILFHDCSRMKDESNKKSNISYIIFHFLNNICFLAKGNPFCDANVTKPTVTKQQLINFDFQQSSGLAFLLSAIWD
jgi:hypothetical protein